MINVLDIGSVRLVEHWGTDERIIEAARMSTDKGFLGWEPNAFVPGHKGDLGLLTHLWKNKHLTPFEMAGAVIEVKAPIFVFREWHRHRTQSYNEMSARYIPLPDKNYQPTLERLKLAGGANKQAQGTTELADDEKLNEWLVHYKAACEHAQIVYERGLALGIPKEVARLPVPVSRYSQMRAQANLRNWLAFLELRMAPAAQWEIRQYANAVHDILVCLFPRTLKLFDGEPA